MSKKKKIIIIAVALVLLGAGAVFAYVRTKKNAARVAGTEKSSPTQNSSAGNSSAPQTIDPATGQAVNSDSNSPADTSSPSDTSDNSNTPDSGSNNGTTPIDANKTDGTTGGSMFAHITTEHCNSDCQAFANNLTYFEYCQQVCGIAPIKKISNCDGKKDLEKDYCLKDLAIGKENASLCDDVKDANIKKTCKNRILQDILESQTQSPQ